jgi:hypothetical protein
VQHFILVSLGHSFHCAVVDEIFVAGYFRSLLVSRAEQCRKVGWQMNDGLESIWKEVGRELSVVLSLHLSGRIKKVNDKSHLAQPVSWSRFESSTSRTQVDQPVVLDKVY